MSKRILGDPKRLSRGHVLAWHFVEDTGKLGFGDGRKVVVGKTLSIKRGEKPECCFCGLHGSVDIVDALRYACGSLLCRVELWGDLDTQDDKVAARNRRVIWMVDATDLLQTFACWCAQRALERERAAGREPAKESWAAIEAKLAWLRGEIDTEELAAASATARAAAWAAASAAARAAQRAQLITMLNGLEWEEVDCD